jgi:crossover junction endodeoxyribonuclease RuvC
MAALPKRYVYIGIDPGLDGAVCVINGRTADVTAFRVPTVKKEKGSSKRVYHVRAMVDLLLPYRECVHLVTLEIGRAAPGQGVVSMFRFGHGCGLWEGILAAMSMPYLLAHPRTWQKAICAGLSGDAKSKALQAVQSLLPTLDLHVSERGRTPHQGIVDAACLALYAQRWVKGITVDSAIDPQEFSESL